MAEKNNDHLADALAALSAGEHSEPDANGDDATPAARTAPLPVTASVRPPAPRVAPPPVGRPAVPSPVARPAANSRSAAPAVPPQPTARATSPAGSPSRANRPQAPASATPPAFIQPEPVAPQEDSFAPTDEHAGEWVGEAPADDDAMLAPAPDAATLNYAYSPSKAAARKVSRSNSGLETKRTLIPILLTTGVMFLILGCLKFIASGESSFAGLPMWFVGLICGMGALLLVFAAFTMMQVKSQLDLQGRAA